MKQIWHKLSLELSTFDIKIDVFHSTEQDQAQFVITFPIGSFYSFYLPPLLVSSASPSYVSVCFGPTRSHRLLCSPRLRPCLMSSARDGTFCSLAFYSGAELEWDAWMRGRRKDRLEGPSQSNTKAEAVSIKKLLSQRTLAGFGFSDACSCRFCLQNMWIKQHYYDTKGLTFSEVEYVRCQYYVQLNDFKTAFHDKN